MIARRLAPVALALGLSLGTLGSGAAVARQDAGSGADLLFADTLGLPELTITATDDGFEGLPDETEAGRYVVTFTNELSGEAAENAAVGFVRLPDGQTLADLVPEASPAAEEEFDPAAFAWLYDAYVAGGAAIDETGGTVQAIVDLKPGDYVAWADDPESLAGAPTMTVTGEMPADLPTPEADVTVTELGTAEGYAFEMDGAFASGLQVVAIVNKSDQPHFVEVANLPVSLTEDQLMQLFMLDEGAEPPADFPEFDFEEITAAGYAPTQSAGTTQWTVMDLEAGPHWVACWVPDPAREGTPHAIEGMIELIDIADA